MSEIDEYQYHTICTPEMVELNLPLAGLARRCIAMLIDQILLGTFLLALWLGSFLLLGIKTHLGIEATVLLMLAFMALLSVSSQILYFWAFSTFNNGQTLGKQWLGIQVVTDRGGKPSGTTHLIRSIVTLLDLILVSGGISALMILLTEREKRIADYAAGTIVVLVPDNKSI